MEEGEGTSTYTEIQEKIERLQKEAEEIRAKEVAAVVKEIKRDIEKYGLTAEDLGLSSRRRRSKVAPKYKSGDKTWSGRGRKPHWVKGHLEAGGKLSDLVVRS